MEWRDFGGAERDRTAGLLVANEALSQLSYSPTGASFILAARQKMGKGGQPVAAFRRMPEHEIGTLKTNHLQALKG